MEKPSERTNTQPSGRLPVSAKLIGRGVVGGSAVIRRRRCNVLQENAFVNQSWDHPTVHQSPHSMPRAHAHWSAFPLFPADIRRAAANDIQQEKRETIPFYDGSWWTDARRTGCGSFAAVNKTSKRRICCSQMNRRQWAMYNRRARGSDLLEVIYSLVEDAPWQSKSPATYSDGDVVKTGFTGIRGDRRAAK